MRLPGAGATLVRWHTALYSAYITRGIVTAAATPIAGAVARPLVEAVKWWVPARLIGLRHNNDAVAGVETGPRPRLVAGFGDPRMDHSW